MQRKDIVIGGIYSNGKEGKLCSERKVFDIDGTVKSKRFSSQDDNINLFYETIKGAARGNGK